jgi:thiamine-monophosphate kinase
VTHEAAASTPSPLEGEGRGGGCDLPPEFALIARHFKPLAGPGSLDLSDDAAVLTPPPDRELVIAADAMVGGVHFLPDDPADLVGKKLLRTNLSDLAAMGAEPLGYLMTVSAPTTTPDAWFAAFAAGLAADQKEFGVTLLGGDTTSTPGPISLSLTILGTVRPGQAIRRAGAAPGDAIWVSGTIGDGALGLLAATGRLDDPTGTLADRYRRPRPRLDLGKRLHGIASAGMDVSDGLVQDLGHICRASNVAAEIDAASVPLSDAARTARLLERCLTGGDDYELLLAVPPAREAALREAAKASGIPVTRIGYFRAGAPRVTVRGPDGAEMRLARGGWSHFA